MCWSKRQMFKSLVWRFFVVRLPRDIRQWNCFAFFFLLFLCFLGSHVLNGTREEDTFFIPKVMQQCIESQAPLKLPSSHYTFLFYLDIYAHISFKTDVEHGMKIFKFLDWSNRSSTRRQGFVKYAKFFFNSLECSILFTPWTLTSSSFRVS